MTRTDLLKFEIYIMDLAQNEKISNARELEEFSEKMHEHIERALQDYAYGCDIQDYTSFTGLLRRNKK